MAVRPWISALRSFFPKGSSTAGDQVWIGRTQEAGCDACNIDADTSIFPVDCATIEVQPDGAGQMQAVPELTDQNLL